MTRRGTVYDFEKIVDAAQKAKKEVSDIVHIVRNNQNTFFVPFSVGNRPEFHSP